MDFISEIEQEIKNGNYQCYFDPHVIVKGIHSLKKLDKEKLKMISESSKLIQESNKEYTSSEDQKINKLGVILAGSIILNKYEDYITDLTKEEFITLSYFCSSEDLNKYEDYIKLLTKNILDAICNKCDSYYYREILITNVENEIKNNNLKDEEEIISYISNISEEELESSYLEYINEGAKIAIDKIT